MRKRVAAPYRTWDELFPKSDTSKLNRRARRDESFDFVRSQNSQLVLEYGLETTHRLHRLVEGIAAANLRLTRSLILASDFLLKSPRQGRQRLAPGERSEPGVAAGVGTSPERAAESIDHLSIDPFGMARRKQLEMTSTHLSLHYHLIFSTKERRVLIAKSWRERLHSYLGGILRSLRGLTSCYKVVEVAGIGLHAVLRACKLLIPLSAQYARIAKIGYLPHALHTRLFHFDQDFFWHFLDCSLFPWPSPALRFPQ